MKHKWITILAMLLVSPLTQASETAISEVKDCTCYKAESAKNLKPWELDWRSDEIIRQQIDYCVCTVKFDISKVESPAKYLKKGTVVK